MRAFNVACCLLLLVTGCRLRYYHGPSTQQAKPDSGPVVVRADLPRIEILPGLQRSGYTFSDWSFQVAKHEVSHPSGIALRPDRPVVGQPNSTVVTVGELSVSAVGKPGGRAYSGLGYAAFDAKGARLGQAVLYDQRLRRFQEHRRSGDATELDPLAIDLVREKTPSGIPSGHKTQRIVLRVVGLDKGGRVVLGLPDERLEQPPSAAASSVEIEARPVDSGHPPR